MSQQGNILKWLLVTNLPSNLVFIISANAAGVVEQRAGERGRQPAIGTVTAQIQQLLTVDHPVGVSRGRGQVRTVGNHTCTEP